MLGEHASQRFHWRIELVATHSVFVASEDATSIAINGATVATLNRGESYSQIIVGVSEVVTTNPVLIAQFAHGQDFDNTDADPFMMLVTPIEQFQASYTISTLDAETFFNGQFANIVATAEAVSTLTLDGVLVDPAEFTPISSGLLGAQLSLAEGSYNLASSLPFGVSVYGFGNFDSYGYPGGNSVAPVALVDSIDTTPDTISLNVGGSHTVSTLVLDDAGQPLEGILINYSVTGANSQSGFGITDAAGTATFTYAGPSAGTDSIVSFIGNLSDTVTVDWAAIQPAITISTPSPSSQFETGQTVLVSGRVTPGAPEAPIASVTINGQTVQSLDAAGNYFGFVTIDAGVQAYEVVATDILGGIAMAAIALEGIAGTPVDIASLETIAKEDTTFAYTGTSFNRQTNKLCVDYTIMNNGVATISDGSLAVFGGYNPLSVNLDAADGQSAGTDYFVLDSELPGGNLESGETTTATHISISNPDRARFDFSAFVLVEGNLAPVFASAPEVVTSAGSVYQYSAVANDPNGQDVSYSLVSAPTGMTIDAVTGVISWTPDATDVAGHSISVQADDGNGGTAIQNYTLTVTDAVPGNRAPVFVSVPPTSININNAPAAETPVDLANWTIQAYNTVPGDPQANWLINTVDNIATQTVNANPSFLLSDFDLKNDFVGGTWQVNTTLDDDFIGFVFGYQDPEHFYLFDWKQASQGSSSAGMKVRRVNADSALTNLDFNSDAGSPGRVDILFNNSIPWNDLVEYRFELTYFEDSFQIVVKDFLSGNVIEDFTIQDSTYGEGKFGFYNFSQSDVQYTGFTQDSLPSRRFDYDANAIDPDADTVTYSLQTAPAGMTIDSVTGEIIWAATDADLGINQVEVLADDGNGGLTIQAFEVNVVDVQPASVTGTIFNDADNDGVLDTGENGIAGRTVYLDGNVNGQLDVNELTTVTDADGVYVFDNLLPGDYAVRQVNQTGISQTLPANGQYMVALLEGDSATGFDFGNFDTGSTTQSAPVITSTPFPVAKVGDEYDYQVSAVDADGDTLNFSLLNAPAGMTIDAATGLIRWTPTAEQQSINDVLVQADDGNGGVDVQSFDVLVRPEFAVPVITSRPSGIASVDDLFEYLVVAEDPDMQMLTYSLTAGPAAATLDPISGVLAWTPTAGDIGAAAFEIEVFDEDGLIARQAFTLDVRDVNVAPVFASTPILEASAGALYLYTALATDTEDSVTYTLVDGPAGMVVNSLTGLVSWQTEPVDVGSNVDVTVRATDDRGLSVDQVFAVGVAADTEGPTISILTSNTVLLPGDSVTVQVRAEDNVAVDTLVVTIDGNIVTLDAQGRVVYTATTPGLPVIEATATDVNGNVTVESDRIRVIDLADETAPVVAINSPAINSQVTYLTDVAITVTADDLDTYTLEYSLRGTDNWKLLDSGTTEKSNEVVATFDPTLLQNDLYDLRISAFDFSGNIATEKIYVGVEGQAKLGNYALEFADLSVPLAGIPIVIARQYDTLNANESGDFGFGWKLAIGQADIRETVGVSQAELDGVPALFGGANAFFAGTRVYITTPEGQRVGFTFDPVASGGFLGTIWEPKFTADVDTDYELEVPNTTLQQNGDGTFGLYLFGGNYNPREYTLVSKDQIRYTYDQFEELQTVTDRNDVTLEYRDDGIFSSTGESIEFVRDNIGRITEIIDPAGNSLTYVYDANGDLISYADQVSNTWTHEYNASGNAAPHFLERVTGARGNLINEVRYDEDGRFIALVDAFGEEVIQEFDLANNTFVQTDALGNPTSSTFDDRGNIVQIVDANGRTTMISFDDPRHAHLETSITDPRGFVTDFEYDASGNMTVATETDRVAQIQYNENNDITTIVGTATAGPDVGVMTMVEMEYDENGNLTTFTNAASETESFVYDDFGRIISVTDPLQTTVELFYSVYSEPDLVLYPNGAERSNVRNALGGIESATNEVGAVFSFENDKTGRPLEVTDALGNIYQYIYDGELLTKTLDPLLREDSFEFDEKGRLIKYIDAEGGEIVRSYDANNRLASQTNQIGQTELWSYTALNEVETYTNTAGKITTYSYDENSNIVSIEDARGFLTQYEFDSKNRTTKTVDALNQSELYSYDVNDNIVSVTDRNSVTTSYEYDLAGRLVKQIDGLGGVQQRTYDVGGNNISYVDELNNEIIFEYDVLNRLIKQTDAAGFEERWAYDDANRLTQYFDQNNNVTSYTYDASNQLLTATDPLNGVRTITYDAVGNPLTNTDESNRTTVYTYDSLYLLESELAPNNALIQYERDGIGNTTSLTDPSGNTTEYQYNTMNLVSLSTDPLGNDKTFAYDDVGNLTQTVDRLGRITEFVYDGLNRKTSEVWKAADGTFIQEYSSSFDNVGNLLTAAGAGNSYAFTYDVLNLTQQVAASISSLPALVLDYTYDAVGNLSQVIDNFGVAIDSTFDVRNNVTSVNWAGGGMSDARVEYSYDGRGLVTGQQRFSDLAGTNLVSETNNVFDVLGRTTEINHLDSSGSIVAEYQFGFDAASQMVQQIVNSLVSDYGYDTAGQLTSATNSGRPDEAYSYDTNGNRNDGSNLIGANNQLLSDGTFDYEYDLEGNLSVKTELSSGEITEYEYDHRNRLIGAVRKSAGGVIQMESSFGFDMFDRLISRTTDIDGVGALPEETVYTTYDGSNAWADFESDGSVSARYLFGRTADSNIARWRPTGQPGAGTSWYLTDHLGSVRDIVNESGVLVDHIEYDSFGNILSESDDSVGDRYKFTGREWNSEIGQYHYRSRNYDPLSGRFASQDSIGFNGGDANLYRYVANNPLTSTDPTGNLSMAAYGKALEYDLKLANAINAATFDYACSFLGAHFKGDPNPALTAAKSAAKTYATQILGNAITAIGGKIKRGYDLFSSIQEGIEQVTKVWDAANSDDLVALSISTVCFVVKKFRPKASPPTPDPKLPPGYGEFGPTYTAKPSNNVPTYNPPPGSDPTFTATPSNNAPTFNSPPLSL